MCKKVIKKRRKQKKMSNSPLYWENSKHEEDVPSPDVTYKVHRKKRPFNPE